MDAAKYFRKCELKHLEVQFSFCDLNKLPAIFWKKIGPTIYSLKLNVCQLGCKVMKNVILHCVNLKVLQVRLDDRVDVNESFCLPSALKELNIVRRRLESFEIMGENHCKNKFETWKQIFTALCRIFPNLVHFTSKSSDEFPNNIELLIKCEFWTDKNYKPGLAESLAYLRSPITGNKNWKKPLEELSTLRYCYFLLYN